MSASELLTFAAGTAVGSLVSKSNALLRASYKLTLAEQRLILACLAQLDTRRAMRPNAADTADQTDNLRVTALEYADLYGVEMSTAYREIHQAAKRLYERSIKVVLPDGREQHFRWIWGRSTHQRDGHVEISFTPDLARYVTALRGKFTSYGIDQVRRLRSPNAVRLFELMMQWRATGVARIEVAELRAMLQLTYQRFTDIRRFVLEPAIQQITEHTDFTATWKPIRTGRQVDTIEVRFSERSQAALPLGDEARAADATEILFPLGV